MITTMTFGEEDKTELRLAMNGSQYYCALIDIKDFIRSQIKYTELTEKEEKLLEQVRELIPYLEDVE